MRVTYLPCALLAAMFSSVPNCTILVAPPYLWFTFYSPYLYSGHNYTCFVFLSLPRLLSSLCSLSVPAYFPLIPPSGISLEWSITPFPLSFTSFVIFSYKYAPVLQVSIILSFFPLIASLYGTCIHHSTKQFGKLPFEICYTLYLSILLISLPSPWIFYRACLRDSPILQRIFKLYVLPLIARLI
jgi:hypothetical protein